MKFAIEIKPNKSFSFLVVKDFRVFLSVHRTVVLSGVYTYFDGDMPKNCKSNLKSTILFGSFILCLDMTSQRSFIEKWRQQKIYQKKSLVNIKQKIVMIVLRDIRIRPNYKRH